MEVGPTDADILWLLDLRTAAGVRPHDSAHCSILLDGPYLYVNTSNGLTSRHDGVDKPEAPSLVVVDKATGRLVARDGEEIGRGSSTAPGRRRRWEGGRPATGLLWRRRRCVLCV